MQHLYKLDIQGIVYLVDPNTADAYTYDLSNPTKIGHVIWRNPSDAPRLELMDGWAAILELKQAQNMTLAANCKN